MKTKREITLTVIALVLLLVFILTEAQKVSAAELPEVEVRHVWATAYCDYGTTASGTTTEEGRTLAAMPKDFGKKAYVYLDDGDGIIRQGNLIGSYICEDTGGKPIRVDGTVVDIYMKDYDRCMEFGAKRVIVLFVKEK